MKRPLHGFTLIELLVVITIIGMLVGLLLPAINSARESARMTVCKNNLHQLAIAIKEHSDKLGFFPSGGWGSNWTGDPDNGTGPGQPGGWIYQILPYYDQSALHDLGMGNLTLTSSACATRIAVALPGLYCPTRRAAAALPAATTAPNGANPAAPMPIQGTTASVTGRTDYAINGGSVFIANGKGPGSTSEAPTYTWPVLATGSSATSFNGIASVHSKITEAMCPDEKASLYLVGEKYLSPENYITGVDTTPASTDPGDLFSAFSADDVSLIRWGNTTLVPAMDRTANNNPAPNPSKIFGSSHSAGWHAAFCDGHAQIIGWAINPSVHQAMATRNGHEVVSPADIIE